MKMKKFYQKALDEAFVAVQESSDIEFESDEDDGKGNKGKNDVCLMARSVDEDSDCDNDAPLASTEPTELRLLHGPLPVG